MFQILTGKPTFLPEKGKLLKDVIHEEGIVPHLNPKTNFPLFPATRITMHAESCTIIYNMGNRPEMLRIYAVFLFFVILSIYFYNAFYLF